MTLLTLLTLDTVYTVHTVDSVYTVNTVYIVYTVYTVYTVHTVDSFQMSPQIGCLNRCLVELAVLVRFSASELVKSIAGSIWLSFI